MSSSQNPRSAITRTKKTKDSTSSTIPTPVAKLGQKRKRHEARSADEDSEEGTSEDEIIEVDSEEHERNTGDDGEEEAEDSDVVETVGHSGSSSTGPIALGDDHVVDLPESLQVKSQMARDIRLILSELAWCTKQVKGKEVRVKGRWCQVCL